MHWLLGLRTPPKPRVPFILAAWPLVAHLLKLNPRSAAVIIYILYIYIMCIYTYIYNIYIIYIIHIYLLYVMFNILYILCILYICYIVICIIQKIRKCQILEICWDRSNYSICLNTNSIFIDDYINLTYTIKLN